MSRYLDKIVEVETIALADCKDGTCTRADYDIKSRLLHTAIIASDAGLSDANVIALAEYAKVRVAENSYLPRGYDAPVAKPAPKPKTKAQKKTSKK